MPTRNIGILFGGMLIRAKNTSEEVGTMPWQSGALGTMITEKEEIFQLGIFNYAHYSGSLF